MPCWKNQLQLYLQLFVFKKLITITITTRRVVRKQTRKQPSVTASQQIQI